MAGCARRAPMNATTPTANNAAIPMAIMRAARCRGVPGTGAEPSARGIRYACAVGGAAMGVASCVSAVELRQTASP